jgi:hypothetical protein
MTSQSFSIKQRIWILKLISHNIINRL